MVVQVRATLKEVAQTLQTHTCRSNKLAQPHLDGLVDGDSAIEICMLQRAAALFFRV
jgi:hypothetical protein